MEHTNKDLDLAVEVVDRILHTHVEDFYLAVRQQEPLWKRLGLAEVVGYYARAAIRAKIFTNLDMKDIEGMTFAQVHWLGELADEIVAEATSVDVKN